ncbi:MAG: hypothetical protein ACRDH5_19590 [bacterium]
MDEALLGSWLTQATTGVDRSATSHRRELFVSNHLDEIDPTWDAANWDVSGAVAAFRAVRRLIPDRWPGRVSLAVPIEDSTSLVSSPPHLDNTYSEGGAQQIAERPAGGGEELIG